MMPRCMSIYIRVSYHRVEAFRDVANVPLLSLGEFAPLRIYCGYCAA